MTSLKRQLLNSRVLEIAIYLRSYLRVWTTFKRYIGHLICTIKQCIDPQDLLEAKRGGLSRLIWTPLKLVPPGTNFSEIFGPTLKNLFLL